MFTKLHCGMYTFGSVPELIHSVNSLKNKFVDQLTFNHVCTYMTYL